MTREEKIKRLKALKARCERLIVSSDRGPEEWRKDAEALDLALTGLRGPTREMVERMRGEWKISYPLIECQVCGEIYSRCGGNEGKPFDFCPACGSPMTDEAVGMMVERWKEAVDGETD